MRTFCLRLGLHVLRPPRWLFRCRDSQATKQKIAVRHFRTYRTPSDRGGNSLGSDGEMFLDFRGAAETLDHLYQTIVSLSRGGSSSCPAPLLENLLTLTFCQGQPFQPLSVREASLCAGNPPNRVRFAIAYHKMMQTHGIPRQPHLRPMLREAPLLQV